MSLQRHPGFAVVLAVLLAPVPLLLTGCPGEPKAPPPKPCCDQAKIPAGVAPFTIVYDEVTGPSDGQTVKIRAGLAGPVHRDEVYGPLHTLYRHMMTRSALEPIITSAELYASESEAKAGGKPIAVITRLQSEMAPKCRTRSRTPSRRTWPTPSRRAAAAPRKRAPPTPAG